LEGIDGPLYFDMHGLRHTYISMLARVTPVKVAQAAARHGSLNMTERYAHTHQQEVAAAVNQLPLRNIAPANGTAPTVEQLETAVWLLWGMVCKLLVPPGNGSNPGDNQNGKLT